MSSITKKYVRYGIISSVSIAIVITIIFWIFKAFSGITISPELVAWLTAPVSELKIWHLIIILLIIGFATSGE